VIVLQVIPDLAAGGAERSTLDVAAAIVRVGGRALVASRGGRLEGELEKLGGELLRLPVHSKSPVVMAANALRLASIARAEAVDVIHARSRAPAWSALAAARLAGCAFVTTYHGTYNARSALKRFYNSVMARGDAVIANSSYIADRIRAAHGALAREVVVIPRGTDAAVFDPAAVSTERIEAVKAAWGVSGARPIVLMPGRLTRWKGQTVMLDAFATLRARGGPTAELVMPGDDQGRAVYRAELDALVESHRLRDLVRLPGHCSDMPAAYAAADVVVSASIEPEAFGRVAVEGAFMARPVIAADHGGARETVENGVGGRLVPPADAAAMADALAEILSLSPAARLEMGERGAQRARALYSVESMQAANLRLYEKLILERA
jgi:glycosyltransferase involved in cell wall biosynthesis